MDALKRNGYLLLNVEHHKVEEDRKLFYGYISNIPEFRKDNELHTGDIGAGRFGALNFASAYHAPVCVSCDNHVYEVAQPTLIALAKDLGLRHIQLVPDRLCYRTQAQPAESYHYDATYGAEKDDCFLGTIYNLNENFTQVFTCVPGSHKLEADLKGGEYTKQEKKLEYKQKEKVIHIPPYHALVFFENIVHRVSGGKPAQPILRKFVGFRLTNADTEWFASQNGPLLATQGALFHKGGKIAPMYPRLYLANHVDKLIQFANRLKPEMLTDYTYKSGKRKGVTIRIPKQPPPSLQELGAMYDNTENRFKLQKIA